MRRVSKVATNPERQRERLAAEVVSGAVRRWPLLRPLLAVGAGYAFGVKGPFNYSGLNAGEAVFLYCLKGAGWCDSPGNVRRVLAGDLVVLPYASGKCAPKAAQPWNILWIEAMGQDLPEYLGQLGACDSPQVLPVGEDPQFVRLFHDVLRILKSGSTLPRLLQAAHALGALLALAIEQRQKVSPENQDIARKIAVVITYMSEHVDEHLSISSLARLANLSPAYFGSVFRAHTGSSPRDYLHLLRIHRACQMLQTTALNVKEIAANLGYQDQFHFSRQFKAFQGVSPSQYRIGQEWRAV